MVRTEICYIRIIQKVETAILCFLCILGSKKISQKFTILNIFNTCNKSFCSLCIPHSWLKLVQNTIKYGSKVFRKLCVTNWYKFNSPLVPVLWHKSQAGEIPNLVYQFNYNQLFKLFYYFWPIFYEFYTPQTKYLPKIIHFYIQ